jgi:hypothetical protein
MRHVSEAVWVAVFGLFAVVAVGTWVTAREDARGLMRLLTATRLRRILMLIGWMWLGWHFFAR